PRYALAVNFLFTLAHLLYGYRLTQVDWRYSITWTIPQCVLTLRLIALSFDLYDGKNQFKKVCLHATHPHPVTRTCVFDESLCFCLLGSRKLDPRRKRNQ